MDAAPMREMEMDAEGMDDSIHSDASETASGGEAAEVAPTVRKEFADTAYWAASVETGSDGLAEITFPMAENLTNWTFKVWSMGHGTRVGDGSAEAVTRKNLLVRLQTPRFLVERDEVVISANVHNYLPDAKQVRVRLELDGDILVPSSELETTVDIEPNGEQRVDWRLKAVNEGNAIIRALAITDEESDAMQLEMPVKVHGIEKLIPHSGLIAADSDRAAFEVTVPEQRRVSSTRLAVQFSPTLAGAMVDALPYLIDYPYGCTEQTLNRFLPAVLTQQTLRRMGVDLAAIRDKEVNLNPQELGGAKDRADDWKRFKANPVFDEEELEKVVKAGVNRLTEMQLSDGGWGWFSGFGEWSSAHTTAVVVRGLIVAKENDVALVPGVLERGVKWLVNYQAAELVKLNNRNPDGTRRDKEKAYKSHADNLDALVYLVLVEARKADIASAPDKQTIAIRNYLYDDRTRLAVYGLATFGLALQFEDDIAGNDTIREMRDMVLRNLSQYVVTDAENQTAYLNLPGGTWWYWYGSEFEAHAYYLKLLAANDADSDEAAGLVKYLLNNRKHATYWNSTRDTALVVEAMADYLQATGEGAEEMTVEVWLNGQRQKTVEITPAVLFSFDNQFVIEGSDIAAGRHTVELRKQGSGRLYFNAYLSVFSLEDDIQAAGLELKVARKYFKLTPVDSTKDVAGGRGQVVSQKVEKYERNEIPNLGVVESGDLVEIELTIQSKNDYEYILLEDLKAAGFEPVEVRSGYNGNDMNAYVEYRDDRVTLFVRQLARGNHSVSYRMRAETPGQFSALPTTAYAMYAPELKGNSDEMKVRVVDEE
ncbi:MAG: alpha-2-macroglobulin family protein, partial [Aeoliella sp.]